MKRLHSVPGHIWAWLALWVVSGGADLLYHVLSLAGFQTWLLGPSPTPALRFNLDVAETLLHGLVALGLILFVITALDQRLSEDERRQRERESRVANRES